MGDQARFPAGIFVDGPITLGDQTVQPGWARSDLVEEAAAQYAIPWEQWKIHDAFQTPLTGTANTDDLGLIGGTFGAGTPSIQSSDAKATTVTQYARALVRLPIEYVAASSVSLMFHAGMRTTISDGTATLDLECYRSDNEGLVDGADKYGGAAVDINSITLTDKSYTLTAGALSPGDLLDIRITVAITDAATGTAVIGWIGQAWLQCHVKG